MKIKQNISHVWLENENEDPINFVMLKKGYARLQKKDKQLLNENFYKSWVEAESNAFKELIGIWNCDDNLSDNEELLNADDVKYILHESQKNDKFY